MILRQVSRAMSCCCICHWHCQPQRFGGLRIAGEAPGKAVADVNHRFAIIQAVVALQQQIHAALRFGIAVTAAIGTGQAAHGLGIQTGAVLLLRLL